jgi:hypothetical protein
VLAGWGAAGGAVALRWFRWLPRRTARAAVTSGRPAPAAVAQAVPRPPSAARLVWAQTRHANRMVWRDPASVFFAVAFPMLFVVVVPLAFGDPLIDGAPLSELQTMSMMVLPWR